LRVILEEKTRRMEFYKGKIMAEDTKTIEVLDTFDIKEDVKKDITASFRPFLDGLKDLLVKGEGIEIVDANQKAEMKEAKEIRLTIQKKRTGMDKARKEIKEPYLLPGQAIDAVFRAIKGEIEPVEAHLKKQEKFVEELEAKLLDELVEERQEILDEYKDEFVTEGYNLREMHAETFSQVIGGFAAQRKERLAKEKAEEEARINREKAEAEEREKMAEENARLKKEAEEREAKESEERAKQDAILAEERKKSAEAEAKLKDIEDAQKAQEAAEEKARAEVIEIEKVAKDEAEALEREVKEVAERAKREAELAPDKDKLENLVLDIRHVLDIKVVSVEAINILKAAALRAEEVIDYIEEKIETL